MWLMQAFTLILFFQGSEARKNVLFIVADDLRPEIAAMHDNEAYRQMHDKMYTPHLDAFTERSAVFKKAYVQQAICGPSRASFMTGRRPDTTKVYNLDDYFRNVSGDFTTIPQYFKQQGYRTLGMGKIFHPGSSGGGNNDRPSWSDDEQYYNSPSQRNYWYPRHNEKSWRAINESLEQEHPLGDQELTDHAKATLRRLAPKAISGEENFFMAVGFRLPHLPFIFPERYLQYYPQSDIKQPSNPYVPQNMPGYAWHYNGEIRNQYADIIDLGLSGRPNTTWPSELVLDLRRAYYASVSYVDTLFGQIMEEVDGLGLRNNTIVMFGSDHGWQLYEHTAWCKHTNFELATRTPLMFRVPGLTDQGLMSSHLVEYTDIYSTLVELAELPAVPLCPQSGPTPQACTEGTSLVSLMSNPNIPGKTRVFMQYPRNRRDVGPLMGYSMRTDRYRYTEWVTFNTTTSTPDWDLMFANELYDHSIDPDENVNRAEDEDYDTDVDLLSAQLQAGWRAALPNY
ncbi:unnamed protein product [Owenia fusiformis]|uniref:Uncharacterized protein n=1 Tax=Owenia fusiformis TaxID=6347 RepID=A0A8J1XTL1_OWEFU|nr:unnamed protein product [Owenia fusiformis]